MSKTEIILFITAVVSLITTFKLYKVQNKPGKAIEYVDLSEFDNK